MSKHDFKIGDRVQYDGKDIAVYFEGPSAGTVVEDPYDWADEDCVVVSLDAHDGKIQEIDPEFLRRL